MTRKIDAQQFEALIEGNEGLVLVDFFATWCGPCKMLSPILESIGNERADVTVVAVDVDEDQQLAMQYGVLSVPTMILFRGGRPVDQIVGLMPKSTIEARIDRLLASR